jgi:hypothetical protein
MKVFKYSVPIEDEVSLEIPWGATILTFDAQQGWDGGELLCLWALVDPQEERKTTLNLRIAGTGHDVDTNGLQYMKTVFMKSMPLVWHIFWKRNENGREVKWSP